MQENDGVYIPANIVPGRHIIFAVDNVDFAEDTPNGNRTLHGTEMAMYQRHNSEDITSELDLTGQAKCRPLISFPVQCQKIPNHQAQLTQHLLSIKNQKQAGTTDMKWLGC